MIQTAQRAMAMQARAPAPRPPVRQADAGRHGNQARLRTLAGSAPPRVSRKCAACEEKHGSQDTPVEAIPQSIRIEGEPEELPPPTMQAVVRRTPTPLARHSTPLVQRATTWDAKGHVDPVNNLADVVVNGAAAGETWPVLNSRIVRDGTEAGKALNAPTLAFAAVPAAQKGAADEYDATIAGVANNAGSFDSRTLTAGPWSKDAPKARIRELFDLDQCSGNGTSTFTAIGKPSPHEMFEANQRHENHHAIDDAKIFADNVGTWDTKLTAARRAGAKYHGATKTDAEAVLFQGMGGTLQEVADAFVVAVTGAGNDYHRTPAGGNVHVANWQASPNCSTSSAECRNPS